jgi:hypothetical protein
LVEIKVETELNADGVRIRVIDIYAESGAIPVRPEVFQDVPDPDLSTLAVLYEPGDQEVPILRIELRYGEPAAGTRDSRPSFSIHIIKDHVIMRMFYAPDADGKWKSRCEAYDEDWYLLCKPAP